MDATKLAGATASQLIAPELRQRQLVAPAEAARYPRIGSPTKDLESSFKHGFELTKVPGDK
jgi:hypothetical protein